MRNGQELKLGRCPHCGIAGPRLSQQWNSKTHGIDGHNIRIWVTYTCTTCGGVVLTVTPGNELNGEIREFWPPALIVAEDLPSRAKEYLSQALASLHAPAGGIILAASAVDSMFKQLGYKDGTLYSRIDAAAANHVITSEMAAWAHEIRLDANDQRHADDNAPLPSVEDVEKVIEFATALGQFLFVLPARVARGRQKPTP